ncbi:MAG: tetratricopeptide repeat protein [candidate division NC10 bacterium]|nr:tetratricopeptide repeat protein [candidate division NC10 bacterium]
MLLARLYHLNGQFDEAIAYGGQAVALSPNNAKVAAVFSAVSTQSGRPERGLEMMKKTMRLNPYPEDWYQAFLGLAYIFTERHEEAFTPLKKCSDRIPDYIFCHVHLIFAYMEAGREAEARAEAKEVLRINPNFSSDSWVLAYKDPAVRKRMVSHLQKAGLP